ncbi:MAG: histidine kinase, partial [Phaeodactylibacter sp.]|nr:histidine kinase [Phaeodactylibacter sp.]
MRFKPWHIGFWAIYVLLNALVNTAFAGTTDLSFSPLWRLLRFVFAEVVVLPPGLLAAYWFIYRLVPRYFYSKRYAQLIGRSLLLILPLIVLNRVLTFYVVFPALYGEYPTYSVIGIERLLYAFVDLLSAIGLFSTVQLLLSRQEEKQRQAELQQEKLESELRFLRAQTNPHFLFNTLNNIYALARKQSEHLAPVVLKLSKLLRFMLYECSTATIPLEREIQVIRDYLDLEALRYNDRLQVDFEVNLEDPETAIAPLLLLPFVENA